MNIRAALPRVVALALASLAAACAAQDRRRPDFVMPDLKDIPDDEPADGPESSVDAALAPGYDVAPRFAADANAAPAAPSGVPADVADRFAPVAACRADADCAILEIDRPCDRLCYVPFNRARERAARAILAALLAELEPSGCDLSPLCGYPARLVCAAGRCAAAPVPDTSSGAD